MVLLQTIKKIDPFFNGDTGSDIDLSKLFGKLIKDEVVYNTDSKSFWKYNSKYWEEDKAKVFIRSKAKEFAKAMFKYAEEIVSNQNNNKSAKKYERDVSKLRNYPQRETLIKDTITHISVDYSIFDKNGELFNCLNGTYNFETSQFKEHDAKDFITKMSNVIYNPNAKCENWEKFINEIMIGDNEKINYLQRLLAYCLTTNTNEEQMYLFYGATTRNGKSTLVETISHLMGKGKGYSNTSQPDLIGKKNIDNRAPSEDLARLRGARAVFMSEPPKEMTINCSMVKQLVGGDTVSARKLRENTFEYIPQFKMIMNTNHLCRIDDATMFYGNKVVVITFERHFTPEEQDHKLKQKLKNEAELSGIFNWIIDGYKMYSVKGMKAPQCIVNDTNEYAKKSDVITEFISEILKYQQGNVLDGKELYNEYQIFCRLKGYIGESNQMFYQSLKNTGILIDSGKVNGKNCRKRINNYAFITNHSLV